MVRTTRVPTYQPHTLIQCNGVLGAAGSAWEIFSYSLRIHDNAGGVTTTPAVLQDYVNDVVAFHGRAESRIHTSARLTNVKVALVEANGKWQGSEPLLSATVDQAGAVANSGNSNMLAFPPQCALAVTLRTAHNTPRARGRFYLPLPVLDVSKNDGLVVQAEAELVLGSVAQLLTDLNNLPGIDQAKNEVVSVMSTFGDANPVTSVSVGRVVDTMRSRRNALRESYVTQAGPF